MLVIKYFLGSHIIFLAVISFSFCSRKKIPNVFGLTWMFRALNPGCCLSSPSTKRRLFLSVMLMIVPKKGKTQMTTW